MLVNSEDDWQRYRGYNPDFANRARKNRARQGRRQAASDEEAKRAAYIAVLKAEAAKAQKEALAAKQARRGAEEIHQKQQWMEIREARTEFQRIMALATYLFDVTKAEIIDRSRSQRIVRARHFVMYWARRRTDMSYPQIARILGHREHTTVIHGAKAYVEQRARQGRKLRGLA